jgi:tRNA-specific adenosine deaminase 2
MEDNDYGLSTKEIEFYMNEALLECEKAIECSEVPVGCIFLHLPEMKVIARGHNLTNVTKNATTHSEINCINSLYNNKTNDNVDIAKLLSECILFVTCEPCIMCAYALNQVKIKAVYFGCENDKFGGNGSILSLHKW